MLITINKKGRNYFMSDAKEHKAKKSGVNIGAVIILIISAIVFLPAGGIAVYQGLFNHNKTPSFGSFDGQKITYEPNSVFVRTANNIMQQYRNYGIQITDQYYYYIFNQAFNQSVMNLAYTSSVKKSGYKVPEQAVNRMLVSLPYFQDENGAFSQKMYNQADENTVNTLRGDIKDSLIFSRYADDLFGSSQEKFNGQRLYGLKSVKAEQNFIEAMAQEKHSFVLASFDTATLPESEAVSYGKQNPDNFVRYDISAISVDSESEAKSILKQITNSEITFEDALAEKSKNYYTEASGKLSNPYQFQIADMLEDTEKLSEITSLNKDELSAVIKTKHGYSIFRNDGEATPADFEDSNLISTITTYLKENEASYIENYYTKHAEDFIADAALSNFASACKKYSVDQVEVSAFPLNYGNSPLYAGSEQAEISSIVNNADLLNKVFSLKKGEISSPLVAGTKILVLQCTNIQNDEVVSSDSFGTTLENIDTTSANSTLMNSSKVENNFMQTYISTFMNNSNN